MKKKREIRGRKKKEKEDIPPVDERETANYCAARL